jgi:hypothetical protein
LLDTIEPATRGDTVIVGDRDDAGLREAETKVESPAKPVLGAPDVLQAGVSKEWLQCILCDVIVALIDENDLYVRTRATENRLHGSQG